MGLHRCFRLIVHNTFIYARTDVWLCSLKFITTRRILVKGMNHHFFPSEDSDHPAIMRSSEEQIFARLAERSWAIFRSVFLRSFTTSPVISGSKRSRASARHFFEFSKSYWYSYHMLKILLYLRNQTQNQNVVQAENQGNSMRTVSGIGVHQCIN